MGTVCGRGIIGANKGVKVRLAWRETRGREAEIER